MRGFFMFLLLCAALAFTVKSDSALPLNWTNHHSIPFNLDDWEYDSGPMPNFVPYEDAPFVFTPKKWAYTAQIEIPSCGGTITVLKEPPRYTYKTVLQGFIPMHCCHSENVNLDATGQRLLLSLDIIDFQEKLDEFIENINQLELRQSHYYCYTLAAKMFYQWIYDVPPGLVRLGEIAPSRRGKYNCHQAKFASVKEDGIPMYTMHKFDDSARAKNFDNCLRLCSQFPVPQRWVDKCSRVHKGS